MTLLWNVLWDTKNFGTKRFSISNRGISHETWNGFIQNLFDFPISQRNDTKPFSVLISNKNRTKPEGVSYETISSSIFAKESNESWKGFKRNLLYFHFHIQFIRNLKGFYTKLSPSPLYLRSNTKPKKGFKPNLFLFWSSQEYNTKPKRVLYETPSSFRISQKYHTEPLINLKT